MIIVDSSPAKTKINFHKPLLYTSLFFLIILVATPAIFAISSNNSPTGSYLNPLPENELADAPTPTSAPKQSLEQLVLTAQAYLEKAIELSHKDPQSETDHQQIITFLNSGLDLANTAVTSSPNTPESYLVRARILASSTTIRPDATQLAQKDLETAQLLSGGQTVSFPTKVNLINYTPTQQASLATNLIIAAPEESSTSTSSAQTGSNIKKHVVTISKGELTTNITDPSIIPSSYIYLIPATTGQTPFVQAKSIGTATIAITQTSSTDLELEYWIVNP